jgi:hypothetical protein
MQGNDSIHSLLFFYLFLKGPDLVHENNYSNFI